MMMNNMKTKVLLVVLFLVIISAGVVMYVRRVVVPSQTAKFSLTTQTAKPRIGEQMIVKIEFMSRVAEIVSFDAVINYDPAILRIDEIKPTTVFSMYPRKIIESDKKRFVVSGLQEDLTKPLLLSSGSLAEVLITPLKSGKTKLEFLVVGSKYTNMLNSKEENVLGTTEGVELEVGGE
jgi:hypothetical protein